MRRRHVLSLSFLLAASAPVAACASNRTGGGGSASPSVSSSPAPSATAASSATAVSSASEGTVHLEGIRSDGTAAAVEVGPAVRSGDHTVVRLRFTTEEESAGGVSLDGQYSLMDVCLLSLDRGVMWPELDTSQVMAPLMVSREEPLEVFPVFAALDQDVDSVELLVPAFGVALGVPVVEESDADFSAREALSSATLDRQDKGPLPLEYFAGVADGSYDVEAVDDTVTVTLSSDVTFAVDSAELSTQADGVLQAASAQLSVFPSGGALSIVGHTDDVADEAYNLDLSRRRAQAVSDRLGQLTDLSRWTVSVEGKGESEPRVDGSSDEARAANRRVELVATPQDPSEADATARADLESGQMPAATGASGRGPDGVEVEWPDLGRVRLEIDEVRRVGGFLAGVVRATSLDGDGDIDTSMGLPQPFKERWAGRDGTSYSGSDSLTLLVGGMRYLAADYQSSSGVRRPLVSQNLPRLAQDVPMPMPVVWPDTGQESVVVDLPGTGNSPEYGPVVRLTDIPVV